MVDHPNRETIFKWIRDDFGDQFFLLIRNFASTDVWIDVSFLANCLGKTATNTLDLCESDA
jgi:hypothetical protein